MSGDGGGVGGAMGICIEAFFFSSWILSRYASLNSAASRSPCLKKALVAAI